MPDSFIQLPADSTGKKLRTFDTGTDHIQYVNQQNPMVTFRGRASTFRMVGRALGTSRPLMTFWNGSASKVCRIKAVGVDCTMTAAMAVTVVPALLRFYRVSAAPLNGATITKVAEDVNLTSDVNIVLRQDATADGTNAVTALAATVLGGAITQEFAPRLITAAGYEMFDKTMFFDTSELVVRPNDGWVLRIDYPATTADPASLSWVSHCIWTEE